MIRAILCCCLVLGCASVHGSGGEYAAAVFVHDYNPGDIYAFNRGHLGVLRPTYQRRHLVAAYRWLSGLDLNEQEARLLAPSAREVEAQNSPEPQIEAWLAARRKVAAAATAVIPDRQRADYQFSPNCAADAFRVAAATLRSRAGQYGQDAPWVRRWLAAQDTVFGNCAQRGKLPEAAPADAPPWLRQDRRYQAAAARFYQQEYRSAAEEFAAIAADPESPWRRVAVYLAARSLVRLAEEERDEAAVLGLRADAARAIDRVLLDPDLEEWHLAAIRLRARVADRPSRMAALEQAVLATRLSPNGWQDMHDFVLDSDRSAHDLGRWLRNFEAEQHEQALTEAIQEWQKGRARPWLIAGLRHARELGRVVPELDREATALGPGDPGYLTADYYRLGALRSSGKTDQASEFADTLLAVHDLDTSARNLLLAERTALAPDLGSFLRDAVREPVELGYPGSENGYYGTPERIRSDPALHWREELRQGKAVYFGRDATDVINAGVSLALLREAADKGLPRHLQREVLTAAFTRSFLLGRPDARLVPALLDHYPEIGELRQFETGTDEAERTFLAALVILKLPGASPLLASGIGRHAAPEKIGLADYRWWDRGELCRFMADRRWDGKESRCVEEAATGRFLPPPFLQGPPLQEAQTELAAMLERGAAPTVLGRVILDWGKRHMTDARLPEALHLVVRASRYGSGDCGTGGVSKEAYRLLHTRFDRSPWTKRTPYWYADAWHCSQKG